MGFIEDLRRQKEFDQKVLKEKRERQEQENAARRMLSEERISSDRIRRGRLYDRSKQMFKESGLEKLIEEIEKIEGKSCFEGPMSSKGSYWEQQEKMRNADRLALRFVISIESKEWGYGGYTVYKYFEMEINAEGTIKFKSGLLGSSTKTKSVWQRGGNSIEDALGRAYRNPRVKRESYRRHEDAGTAGPG